MSGRGNEGAARDRLIQPASAGRWPRGISCEGGFRILGTPLGFSSARGANLKFLSSVDDLVPARGSRVLTTPFIAEALAAEERGLDALTLDYDRTIRLGRMDIRQYPAGLGPGSSQLEVAFKDRRLVLSSGVRMAAPLCASPTRIPECDILLLDARPAEPRPPSPRGVAAKIEEWIEAETRRGRVPALVAGSIAAALDIACLTQRIGLPVRATRPLYELYCRVEKLGFAIPLLRRLEQEWPTRGAVIHLARLWAASARAERGRIPAAHVGPGRAVPDWAEAAFRLGEQEDRPGLVGYVQRTGATEVALGPKCDEATAARMRKSGIGVHRVPDPTQMPLPF
jgi:hypothetical protein